VFHENPAPYHTAPQFAGVIPRQQLKYLRDPYHDQTLCRFFGSLSVLRRSHSGPNSNSHAGCPRSPINVLEHKRLSQHNYLWFTRCSATTNIDGVATKYGVVRKRGSDGSLTFTPRVAARPRCTIVISPLRYGTRRLLSISCAKSLKNAVCSIS
jgi:hypothetical protein